MAVDSGLYPASDVYYGTVQYRKLSERTWLCLSGRLVSGVLFYAPGALVAPRSAKMCVSLFAAVLGVVLKRVALVTGANKGIGKEVARLLGALPDHAVVLGCRNEQLGVAAAAELQVQLVNQGRRALHVGLPLTDTTPFRHRRRGATPPTAGWT